MLVVIDKITFCRLLNKKIICIKPCNYYYEQMFYSQESRYTKSSPNLACFLITGSFMVFNCKWEFGKNAIIV